MKASATSTVNVFGVASGEAPAVRAEKEDKRRGIPLLRVPSEEGEEDDADSKGSLLTADFLRTVEDVGGADDPGATGSTSIRWEADGKDKFLLAGPLPLTLSPSSTGVPPPPLTSPLTSSVGQCSGVNTVVGCYVVETMARIPKYMRQPLLHAVVLFASDSKVMKYSQEVQLTFVSRGIDVFLQTEASEGSNVFLVKPEHLADIIATSKADYLIVLGDRNMRNRSCQAKEGGRLVEMSVESRVTTILAAWETEREHHQQAIDLLRCPDPWRAIALSSLVEKGCKLDPVNPNVFTTSRRDCLLSHHSRLKSVGASVNYLYKVLQAARGCREGRLRDCLGSNYRRILQLHGCRAMPLLRKCPERILSHLLVAQQILVHVHQHLVLAFGSIATKPVAENPHVGTELQSGLPSEAHRQCLLRELNQVLPRLEDVAERLHMESETTCANLQSIDGYPKRVDWVSVRLRLWKRYSKKLVDRDKKRGMAGMAGDKYNMLRDGGWICPRCESGNVKGHSVCAVCGSSFCSSDASMALESCYRGDCPEGVISADHCDGILLKEIGVAHERITDQARKLAAIFGVPSSASPKTSPMMSLGRVNAFTSSMDQSEDGRDLYRLQRSGLQAASHWIERRNAADTAVNDASDRKEDEGGVGASAKLLWSQGNIWKCGSSQTSLECSSGDTDLQHYQRVHLSSFERQERHSRSSTMSNRKSSLSPKVVCKQGSIGSSTSLSSSLDPLRKLTPLEALAAASDAARGGTGALTPASLAAVSAVLDEVRQTQVLGPGANSVGEADTEGDDITASREAQTPINDVGMSSSKRLYRMF